MGMMLHSKVIKNNLSFESACYERVSHQFFGKNV